MDQDKTWYALVGLGLGDFVLDGDPARKKRHSPTEFLAHVYAGWMKTPLGSEEDLGPGTHCVRRGHSSPSKGAQQPPLFGPCLL